MIKPHEGILFAGVGRRCTNPPPNIAHGGWGAQKHEQAEGIDMDLWVTALALCGPSTSSRGSPLPFGRGEGQGEGSASSTTLLLDLDIQILTNERADQIRLAVSKETGVPFQNIRAAATHTHSGPVPYKSWIEKGYELVGPWFENVARWSAEAAQEALADLQPVSIRTGRGQCNINTNRRAVTASGERFLGINPDGPCDREVLVVRFDTLYGSALATLVNYACHATIMGPSNKLITPDFPGAMKRVVEAAVGGKCLFFQGSAGDQGPMQGFIADTKVYRKLGAILGHEAAGVALSLSAIPTKAAFREVIPSGAPLGMYDSEFAPNSAVPLRIAEREISVPLREGLPEKETATEKLDYWKSKLKAARDQKDEAATTEATYMARRADIQLRMADDFGGKTAAGVRAHFVTFGDIAIVGCNIEPFCEIGIEIKKRSPFPTTFMCGYTNGRMAYMPTAEEWSKGGYEVENSPFGQSAADALIEQILKTLHDLRE